ncbi:hypothetical protein FWC63_01965 [Candidatus Saccharibacteria bacterium]|nr:hypothetical protein [Candidatus Saccharibacteria bacterium]
MMTYFDRFLATCEDFNLPADEAAALGVRVNAACEKLALSKNATHADLLRQAEREIRKFSPDMADFYKNYDRII